MMHRLRLSRTVGDGRSLYDRRSISVHASRVDGADGLDPRAFPRVHDHLSRMAERPEVQRALASEGFA